MSTQNSFSESMFLAWVPNGDARSVILVCPEDRGLAKVTVKIQIGNSCTIIPKHDVHLRGQVPMHTFRDETEDFDPHNDLFMVVVEPHSKYSYHEPHSLTLENTNACNFCLSAEAMLQCAYSQNDETKHGWCHICYKCFNDFHGAKGTTPGCTNGKPCRGDGLPCKWESCEERHAFFPSDFGTKANRFFQKESPCFEVTNEFVDMMDKTCGVRCKKDAFEFTYSGPAVLQQKNEDSNTRGGRPSGMLVKQDNAQDTSELKWINPIVYVKAHTYTISAAKQKWGAKDLFDRNEKTGEMECYGEAMQHLKAIAWPLHRPLPCMEFFEEPDEDGKRASYIVFISPNAQLPGLCGINYDPVTEQYYWYVLDFTSPRSVAARRTDVLWNKTAMSVGLEKSAAARTIVSTSTGEKEETHALFRFQFERFGSELELVRDVKESTKIHAVYVALGGMVSERVGVAVDSLGSENGTEVPFRLHFNAFDERGPIANSESEELVKATTGTESSFAEELMINLEENEKVCTLAWFRRVGGKIDAPVFSDEPVFRLTIKRKFGEVST